MTFRHRIAPWLGLLFRLVLAAILVYAGIVKLFEPDGAKRAIQAYRIFPPQWAPILGWGLPILEVALGLLLLVGLFTRWAALVSGLLMVAFIAGIASVWARGYSIDCGCFGGGGDVSPEGLNERYTAEIIRDVIFALMAGFLVVWPHTKLSLDPAPREESLDDGGFDDHEQTLAG